MNSRERVRTIIAGGKPDRCAFWLGQPAAETWPIYHRYFGTTSEEELRRKLGDDFRWITPQWFGTCYANASNRLESIYPKKSAHGDAGPLADAESLADLQGFPWPKPGTLDFSEVFKHLDQAGDVYRASGFWTCFYHNVMDLFGMEAYLIKMYEHPEVVEEVTNQVCQWYYDANEQFLEQAGDRVDAFFFGNDFGTQLDLICGLPQFDQFILPWFRKFTDQGHRHQKQVILHSCGAIHRVIDRLIDSGVDCLHPLQALARDMDAATLARDFRGRIAFLGGIDTQNLLVNGSPQDIRDEVRRVKEHLGPNLIISASHEAILPNVPPENIAAMAETAAE